MTSDTGVGTQDQLVRTGVRRAGRRLVPLLILLYFVNYLDRVNIGFAGPNGMNAELGLSATLFGVAAGVFFIGYLLLEVPSNLMLHRFGARRWIARILVTWGIVATIMAFVPNATWLIVLRFLLGVAEAGFFPGIILYLTYWFPAGQRARMTAWFMTAIPISTAVGARALYADHPARRRAVRPVRVAGDVPDRGHPVGAAGRRGLVPADRPAVRGGMDAAGRARRAGGAALDRGEGGLRSQPDVGARGAAQPARARAVLGVLRGGLRALRARLLPPDDHQGLRRPVRHPLLHRPTRSDHRDPLRDRIGRDGRMDPPRGEPDVPGGRARADRRHRDPGGPLPVEPMARDARGHDLRVRRARRAARLLGPPHGLPDRRTRPRQASGWSTRWATSPALRHRTSPERCPTRPAATGSGCGWSGSAWCPPPS